MTPSETAAELRQRCLAGQPVPDLVLHQLVERALDDASVTGVLFRELVEPLCDPFDAVLVDRYVELFSTVIASIEPRWSARELRARYARVRRVRSAPDACSLAYVLSRVTLGADVAVTSVVLDAVKKRYPDARVVFVGNRKNHELFAADGRIEFLEAPYARGGALSGRIAAGIALADLLAPGALVVDPDSRLTQLGLVPLCQDPRYLFFESRAYGGDSSDPLPVLTACWAREVFGVEAAPYLAPLDAGAPESAGSVTMSLGVGENLAKRVSGAFEAELVDYLIARGHDVLLDEGAGGEESERVRALAARFPGVRTYRGPFAPFAAAIARSVGYIGYDSAGQHVAAAAGVPLVTVFAGAVSDRMRARWTPHGPGPTHVVDADGQRPDEILALAIRAFESLPD